MIRLLVLFGAGLFIGLVFGFGLGRWVLPGRDDDEPPTDAELEAEFAMFADDEFRADFIDPPGPAADPVRMEPAGPGVQDGWEPAPEDRVYRWAHREPLRRDTQPLTVIDWERVSWADRLALEQWDWSQRMHAWVEDWDRDQLEAA